MFLFLYEQLITMFFFRNVFLYLGVDVKRANFLDISFKKRYKLYLFFSKNKSYFSRFFGLFLVKNLSIFMYLNFLRYVVQKNFNNSKFKAMCSWVSDENLFYCLSYFLNKVYRAKLRSYNNNTIVSNSILKFFRAVKRLDSNALLSYKRLTNQNNLINYSTSYDVKYSGTSLGKYLNNTSLSNLSVYFLRKTRSFNKGRYSRNRQNYRTGVYWCLYINIMVLFALYFNFYGFVFNFGYLWWLLYSLMASFFVPRMIKFRLYDPRVLLRTFTESLPLVFHLLNKKF